MKTAMQGVMDIIEMEHNNGVEISHGVLWKMLNEAKKEEKQQIIEAVKYGFNDATKPSSDQDITFQQYYYEKFETNKETLK